MIETNSGAFDTRPLVSPACNCTLLELSGPPRISPKGSHDLLFAESGPHENRDLLWDYRNN